MKNDLKLHAAFLIAFFLVVSLYKSFGGFSMSESWFTFQHLVFWIGGLIGILIVYLDHFIYAFFLKPAELVSQKAAGLANRKKYLTALEVLMKEHNQNDRLIFHSVYFQLIFLLFAFFVFTSTNGLLGRGIVLGILSHLLVDMARDLVVYKNINGWFQTVPFTITQKQQSWYVGAQITLLVALGLFL